MCTLTNKEKCVFLIVISSKFRLGQYTDDDHRGNASHFSPSFKNRNVNETIPLFGLSKCIGGSYVSP